jgi:pimeloyl-ACP methyl ester carboxylesterase
MRFVESADGVQIATYEEGNPAGPTLVLAHGWPDSHALWDGAVPLLADRFRIVRYDNRGAGLSAVPKPVRAYDMARFADDFAAVIAALSPGTPVHVMAHDWGSVGVWEYLSRPEAADRIASFTSVAGPSTDHYGGVIFDGLSRPHRPIEFVRALGLAARLTYWIPFSIPVLAPAAMRRGLARRLQAKDSPHARKYRGDNFDNDAANSLKIYQAIAFRLLRTRRRDHYVTIPVQIICNDDDPVVRPYGYREASRWIPRLWRRHLKSGHWAPFSHPHALAEAVTEFVDHLGGQPAARGLLRAEVGRSRAS